MNVKSKKNPTLRKLLCFLVTGRSVRENRKTMDCCINLTVSCCNPACQLPSNDLEGRWWLPEAPSDDQGCCAKRISRAHCLQTIKTACKSASCVCRVNELLCTEVCACMAYDCEKSSHWFWWIRVSKWWRGVDSQLVVVMLLEWNADGKEPVIYDCYWTYGTGSRCFFRLNKDIGDR